MAVNVPVNSGGIFLTAGNSATGSFGGMLALAGGPSASIVNLKYINGYTVSNPGFNVTYSLSEATVSSFGMANGSKLELVITSCSLAANSSPVFLYN
jgi:hypothetical protein